jgi:hypothetical protein
MKVALLQLSDIHIQSDKDFIIKYKDHFCRSCKALINECTKLIVVITGDIAYSGSREQYEIAYKWLKECEAFWRREALYLNTVEYIAVPGNHDCDFSQNSAIRASLAVVHSSDDEIDEKDIESMFLSPQANFWDFYSRLRGEKLRPDISWVHEVLLKQDYHIVFHCYNSAFLSQLNEKVGGLIIPKNKFIEAKQINNQGIVIALYHHSTGWLNPNTQLNNKKAFESHIFSTSDVAMCGHEHSSQGRIVSSLSDYRELIYLESPAFQYSNTSLYSLIMLDTDESFLVHHQFEYSHREESYLSCDEPALLNIHKKQSGILFTATWEHKLGDISIPLKHTKKAILRLSDIFVFPDLDPLSYVDGECMQYVDSENLLEDSFIPEQVVFLEGENQAGKTSLLRMLYSQWYKRGVYPIMLSGQKIMHYNIDNYIKSSYKEQYQHKKYSYSLYQQLDRSKKIVFIDDFDKSSINDEHKSKLLTLLLLHFDKVIVTSNIQMDAHSILLDLRNTGNLKRFKIIPLGCRKRNALIEKWIRLGEDPMTLDEQYCLEQVKNAYDSIYSLMGQQLIPSYPVFVLSLLQGLNNMFDKFDTSQTSYAFCYNALIIASFVKSGMEKENIDGVLRFLSEFAYYRYGECADKRYFDQSEFDAFCTSYKKDYIIPYSPESLLQNLCKADIIRSEDGYSYSFTYRYIFYYLIAQKISRLVNDNNADGLVRHLCDNLHKEREANILIFLVFLNGTGKQLDDVLLASMLPFEDQQPITLNTNDPLFKSINDVVDAIKSDVMRRDVNPKENREEALRNSDQLQGRMETEGVNAYPTEKDFEENSHLRDISSAVKVVQILGQIVRNQKNTLKKEELLKLIEEAYNVCFRSISFFGTLIEELKGDITEHFVNSQQGRCYSRGDELQRKIHQLLHMLLFRQCLASFSSLSRAIGMGNLHELYQEVATRMGTPAAKIISFTINTYHNRMKIKDLEELVSEYRNNPVVMKIIKLRVLNYVYNNYVKFDQCQKIGQVCGLKLIDSPTILASSNRVKKR